MNTDFVILSLVTFFASYAITLTGFGFALISMSVYPNIMSVASSNALASALGLIVIVINLIPLWKHVNFRLLLPVMIAAVFGIPVGAFLLVMLDERILRIALGTIILISLALNEIKGKGTVRKESLPLGIIAGFVSGAFGGAYSISGPPVTLYFSSVVPEKKELKANLLFYFMVIIVIRLPILALQGVMTVFVLRTALLLTIPVIAGLVVGIVSFKRLSSSWTRRAVQVLLAVSSVVLIIRAV